MGTKKTAIILAVLAVIISGPLAAAESEIVSTPLNPNTPSFVPYVIEPATSPEAAGSPLLQPASLVPPDASRYLGGMYGKSKLEKGLFQTTLMTQIALNVADYFSTREALKHPGLAEGNPIMKPFVKNEYVFAAVKAGFTTLSYVSLKGLYKKNKTAAWVVSVASNFALSYVVANNLQAIKMARAK